MNNSLLLLLSLLLALTILIGLARALNWNRNKTELYQRIVTWWLIVAVIMLAGQSRWSIHLLIALVVSYSLLELVRIYKISVGAGVILLLLLALVLMLALQLSISWQAWWLVGLDVVLLIVCLVLIARSANTSLARYFVLAGSVCIVGLSACSFILAQTLQQQISGPSLLVFFVFICQANDVAQYCWGKAIGQHKISPTISPSKTWAGFVGGLLTAGLLGYWLGAFLTQMSPFESVIAALLIGVAGFFGDLLVSAFKRYHNIKDSGDILPGHGGLLDRVDSLLLSGWLYYAYLVIVIS